MNRFKNIFTAVFFLLLSAMSFAQQDSIALQREARSLLRNGNELYQQEKYTDASVLYKKALEKNATYKKASYNLGNALYLQKDFKEAVPQFELSAKAAKDKFSKAESYHNLGNSMMEQKQYQQAIDAYKNALRNNPSDDETRYNLAVAKKKLKEQQDKENKDNKDDKNKKDNKDKKNNKDKNDDKGDKKDDQKGDQKDEDKKKDDQKDDQNGDQKDNKDPKQNENKYNKKKEQPKNGKMTPEQIKQLLESLSNEEKKTQKKMNVEKAKGTKTNKEKDW